MEEIIFHHLKQGMDPQSLETFSETTYRCLHKSRAKRPNMSHVVEKLEIALHIQQNFTKMESDEVVKAALKEKKLEMFLSERYLDIFKKWKQNYLYNGFEAHARTQFLSPGIIYTVNLVFKLEGTRKKYDFLRYTFAGETEFSTSFLLHERGDGWMMADHHLCNFICDNKGSVDIDITFECGAAVRVEGIEIRSLERVHHEQELDKEEVDRHPDTYWENKLPNGWKEILKLSNNSVRFGETTFDPFGKVHMDCRSIMVSPETTYAAYFVYKLQENHPRFEAPVEVYINASEKINCYIYLLSPDQSLVVRGKVYQKKRVPQQRKDGWMEVPVWEFQTDTDTISLKIQGRI
ncbi:hypothetical protein LXL04_005776 [Taraxacum kok-saghyz]